MTGRSGEVTDAGAGVYFFDLIGSFRLRAPDGIDLTPLGRKARGLLAYLALNLGGTVSRDRLMALLWSERGEEQARASLRQCLYELRPLTGGSLPPLNIDRHQVGLVAARIETDLARFEALVAGNDATALAATLEALTLPLLDDLEDLDPAFDEWLSIERVRFEDRQMGQLCAAVRRALAGDEAGPARDLAVAVAARYPTNEEAAQLAMTASHVCGQRDAVRRVHQRLEAALRRDLGEVPSPETVRHLEQLLKSPSPTSAPKPPRLDVEPPVTMAAAVAPVPRRKIGRLAIAAAVLALVLAGAAVFLFDSVRPAAGDIILVRLLRIPPNDTPALVLRQGLAAGLARAVAGKDAAFHIADEGSPGDSGAARRAQFVIEGEAHTAGAELVGAVSLRSARSNEILWSGNFSRATTEADAVPQQAAAQIAAALTCALSTRHRGGAPLADSTIRLYLLACEAIAHYEPQRARTLLKEVVAAAPDSSRAWSYLATASGYSSQELIGADAEALRREVDEDADRALALDPHNGEAYYARAVAFQPGLEHWFERVAATQAGLAVEPDNSDLNYQMADDLAMVGRQHEALTYMRRSAALDPLSPIKAADLVQSLFFDGWLIEGCEALEAAERLWPQDNDVWGARLTLAARYGDPGGALALLHDPHRPGTISGRNLRMFGSVMTALQSPTPQNVDAAVAIITEYNKTPDELGVGHLVHQLAVLGRLDDAFALAMRDPGPMATPYDEWMSFRNYMAPFRADPRFMPLAYRQGLVDIWTKTGKWPDFCVEKTVPYDCTVEARRLMAAENRTENLPGNR
jgi:DNA-binding SARP family transcriptional activator